MESRRGGGVSSDDVYTYLFGTTSNVLGRLLFWDISVSFVLCYDVHPYAQYY